jgi:hypothetical protein
LPIEEVFHRETGCVYKLTYPLETPEGDDHYAQWVSAILGAGTLTSSFDYSGPMTETVLSRHDCLPFSGANLHLDSAKLQFANSLEANTLIRQAHRKVWEVEGL